MSPCAAVEALGSPGTLDSSAEVERLLVADDPGVRIAAARTLAINGFASGRSGVGTAGRRF